MKQEMNIVRGDEGSVAKSSADELPGMTRHQHFKMYKPARVLTQFVFNHRKRRRRTLLGDVCGTLPEGTMAIGRLDEDSEGLLLLTTDGKVSERVRRKSVEKEYWAQVSGRITEEAMERLRRGVEIRLPPSGRPGDDGGRSAAPYTTLPCKARRLETATVVTANAVVAEERPTRRERRGKRELKGACNSCGEIGHRSRDCDERPIDASEMGSTRRASAPPGLPPPGRAIRDEARHGPTSWISLAVREGKNRQVRRATAAVGYPTLRLVRVRIGSITADGMAAGEVRALDPSEVDAIDSVSSP